MKRKITLIVDDEVFPSAFDGDRRMKAEVALGFVIARVEREGVRAEMTAELKRDWGVELIMDEQV